MDPPSHTTPNTLPPLLRLPSELHLEILSCLTNEYDFAVFHLRATNRYFRSLVAPPTHADLLRIETVLSSEYRGEIYACRFCLRLLPKTKFAAGMLKGKTGINGTGREGRFCAECGFDTTTAGRGRGYCPGTSQCVGGVGWVWCRCCKLVKRGEEAEGCGGLCKMCYKRWGCACRPRCDRLVQPAKPAPERGGLLFRHALTGRQDWVRVHGEGIGRVGADEELEVEEDDGYEEALWLAQRDCDDWWDS